MHAGGAWYKTAPNKEIVDKKKEEATKERSVIRSIKKQPKKQSEKSTKKRTFWNIVLGVGLSILLALFPAFQVIFIIPMCFTLVALLASFYKKNKPRKETFPKTQYQKRQNQITWTMILGGFASLFLFIISFPYGILISLIPLVFALLSLWISSESVKKGKSGKSCLVMSIVLSVGFILLTAGLLYLIVFVFS
jgi:asparagine N-glycosylation enzyme membrane subunit Stt3